MAETLAGRYELVEVIGQGGMGVVYRGRDLTLDRTVAVKVLPALYAENPTLVERFEREARAAARLSHPNIVAVFDTGQAGTVRYIVMECVPGVSLAALLRERGPLDVPEAVEMAGQIAGALAAAHAGGIVHRDVKPANVMVLPSGAIKVLDFGIARAAADAALTRTTMVLGSAPYIAPEVALGGSADERSDIYSLGCVLYEMLTGRPPFLGDLPAAVMNQHANAVPRPSRELRSDIPIALDALVMRMLAKPPDERPQSAAGLGPALQASLTQPAPEVPTAASTAALDPAPRGDRTAGRAPDVPAPMAASGAPRRTGGRALLALAILILALGTGVALALISSSPSGPRQTTSVHSHQSPTATTTSTHSSRSTPPTSRTTTSKTRSTTTSTTTSSSTPAPSTSLTRPSTTTPGGSSTAILPGTPSHP